MQITVDVPKPLFGQSTEKLARRARLLLVVDDVRAGHLTRPEGARALDMTLDDFLMKPAAMVCTPSTTMSATSSENSTPSQALARSRATKLRSSSSPIARL
jgi:hypothetical protein